MYQTPNVYSAIQPNYFLLKRIVITGASSGIEQAL